MSDLGLVLAVAVITYATRLAFLVRPRQVPEGPVGRFLEVFPLALFIVIATSGLAAPTGEPAITPALAAAAVTTSGALTARASRVTPPSTQFPTCGKKA